MLKLIQINQPFVNVKSTKYIIYYSYNSCINVADDSVLCDIFEADDIIENFESCTDVHDELYGYIFDEAVVWRAVLSFPVCSSSNS